MVRNAAPILALMLVPLTARAELRPYRMVHDGTPRSFRLHVPDTLARFSGPRPLVLVLYFGGGHGWPGGRKVLPGGRAGSVNAGISAPDEIRAFFSRF